LLKAKDPAEYAHVLELHESMLALERARKATAADETRNETRNCPQCGVTFTPARANHRFCTSKCRLQSFRDRSAA
jgi:protein-arginine kinase activator protein McsA